MPNRQNGTVDTTMLLQLEISMQPWTDAEVLAVINDAEARFESTSLSSDAMRDAEFCPMLAAAFTLMSRLYARLGEVMETEPDREEARRAMMFGSDLFGRACRLSYGIGRGHLHDLE